MIDEEAFELQELAHWTLVVEYLGQVVLVLREES